MKPENSVSAKTIQVDDLTVTDLVDDSNTSQPSLTRWHRSSTEKRKSSHNFRIQSQVPLVDFDADGYRQAS
ncbi:hypothetical protein [Ottowia thiooxydans]|uniref:hypothetical protein n=1 Tax=Ottowia thiooxydans TaxID=219182 RepID=UPI000411FBB1|nr:hypothetical protein [Ottowia thiooxydans]